MGYKLGVDVGGTFSDFLLVDEVGRVEVFKELTTPADPSEGMVAGLNRIARAKGVRIDVFLGQVDTIVHGTTITTNAVLTGTAAPVGILITKGFRDILRAPRCVKDPAELYNPKYPKPPQLVPRRRICPVEEEIAWNGEVTIPINEEDVRAGVEYLKKEKVEGVVISFMFSYLNPLHENKARKIVEKEVPNVYITVSHEILPRLKYYERTSTCTMNSMVGPILERYIVNLVERLKKNKFKGTLLIMQSNGGVMSPEVARRFAVNTLSSGPAGGPVSGIFYGDILNVPNILTIDMGGTSFDACLIRDKRADVTVEGVIGHYAMAMPMIDIRSIGAGGGSIAWIEPGGMLQVGPQSAGADPGPACYGRGGELPTVTDADLLLGYLDPDYFFGGEIKLDVKAAQKAFKGIAEKLRLSLTAAAQGTYTVINTKMAGGVRLVSTARGFDPREFLLVVAGGAGPVHASSIAKELEIPLILVPKQSSVFCAMGMLLSNLIHDYIRVYTVTLAKERLDIARVNNLCKEMADEGIKTLEREGIPKDRVKITFTADVRYEGQLLEINVPLPMSEAGDTFSEEDIPKLIDNFHKKHEGLYAYSIPGANCELFALRVRAEGVTEKPVFKESEFAGADAAKALRGTRNAFFDSGFISTPVYDGLKIGHGNVVPGPAIIDEPTTTVVVPPDYELVCDRYSNYILHPKGTTVEALLERMRRKAYI